MYEICRKIITFIIPKKFFFVIEPSLRYIYSFIRIGNNCNCNICNFNANKFEKTKYDEYLCPKCGSLSKDRRLWRLLEESYILPENKVLDFSPSRSIYRKFKKVNNIKYLSTDLSGNFIADLNLDITNIDYPHDSFDLIICYHVLEHVIEDIKAIKELYRILKPGGYVIIQTPFKEGEIYENYEITKPADRLIHFGQEDHVRFYSVEGLVYRLTINGFKVEIIKFDEDELYKLKKETILIAKKDA
jgi:SAM-dependent methyltransferase